MKRSPAAGNLKISWSGVLSCIGPFEAQPIRVRAHTPNDSVARQRRDVREEAGRLQCASLSQPDEVEVSCKSDDCNLSGETKLDTRGHAAALELRLRQRALLAYPAVAAAAAAAAAVLREA